MKLKITALAVLCGLLAACKVEPQVRAVLYSQHIVVCDARYNQAWFEGQHSQDKTRAPEYDSLCAAPPQYNTY